MLLLTLSETYALNRLSSFKNLRRKGVKFDHRRGRPKVLLRHGNIFSRLCAMQITVKCVLEVGDTVKDESDLIQIQSSVLC